MYTGGSPCGARCSWRGRPAVNGVPDVVPAAGRGTLTPPPPRPDNAAFTEARYGHVEVEELRTAATPWDVSRGAAADRENLRETISG